MGKDISGLKVGSQEFLEGFAELMQEAARSPEGMHALAAAIAPTIEEEIEQKIITPLLLTEHNLPAGEDAKYQVRKSSKAYWIADGGQAMESDVTGEEISTPTHRIHATPMVDIGTLKHGNIGSLDDVQTDAASQIRKKIDKRTITVLSAAVPVANDVESTGGVLSEDALNEAVSILEDQELRVKYIVMRGARFADMKGFTLSDKVLEEMQTKGAVAKWNGADILLTAAADLDEVLIIPEEEVGKYPIKEALTVDSLEEKKRFKTGWLVWMQVGHIVTKPERVVKITIVA